MRVHQNLKPAVKNVEHLVDILLSDSMYLCKPLYNCIAGGLETGNIRGLKKSKRAPLESLVTISYEAHFRLELSLALSSQGYRHQYTAPAMSARAKSFEQLLSQVKSDRENHAETAWKSRKLLHLGNESPTTQPTQRESEGFSDEAGDDPLQGGMATISNEYF